MERWTGWDGQDREDMEGTREGEGKKIEEKKEKEKKRKKRDGTQEINKQLLYLKPASERKGNVALGLQRTDHTRDDLAIA